MSWWDSIKIVKRVPEVVYRTIDGEAVRMSFDSVNNGTNCGLSYPDTYRKYVKLQEDNYVLNNVIGKVAKSVSKARFDSLKEGDKLLELVNNPNEKQSKEEFLKEFTIYLLSAGYTFVWKKWASVGNITTLQLINLNPDLTGFNKDNTGVITEVDGNSESIARTDIIMFYDIKKNTCDEEGYSRIKPLRSQIQNIQDAQVAKNVQICNSGVTLISPKANNSTSNMDQSLDTPITTPNLPNGMRTEKQDMEDKLNFGSGIQNRIIVASRGVDSENLGANIAAIKYSDIVEPDVLAVYDAFGVPVELSPYGKNATFDNKEVAETSLIENECEPIVGNFINTINSEFKAYGSVTANFSHVSSVASKNNKINDANKVITDTYINLVNAGIISNQDAKKILTDKGILS